MSPAAALGMPPAGKSFHAEMALFSGYVPDQNLLKIQMDAGISVIGGWSIE
jgi:hypothetical protein